MPARCLTSLSAVCLVAVAIAGESAGERHGGANSPPASPPPALAIATAELSAAGFSVRVPTGTYRAPAGGAPAYAVPGPIVAFKSVDGAWRGHGYLETWPRLLRFTGTVTASGAELRYEFEDAASYVATLTVAGAAVLIDEDCKLGPRNCWVFDAYYGGWEAGAGFAVDTAASNHAFVYLPCFYDRPEVTVYPAQLQQAAAGKPAGVAVLSADPGRRDVAGFWVRDVARWQGADGLGMQLWQRRQLPGDPASRHVLGPDTKSDSTPNPRTAPLLGQSLYEGHVTVEIALGTGTRKLAFTACAKGAGDDLPKPFKAIAAGALK